MALLFDDPSTATKILAANTPGECKSLSRSVKNFDSQKWKEHARDIMKQRFLAKFSQNSACFKTLEATGRSTIAHPSPTDKL